MCCGKEARRTILWMLWMLNFLITSIYYILSFITTANLIRSYKLLEIGISNQIWRAPVAAALLGGMLVLLFNLLSCAVLIRKSIEKKGPGFGYGFIVAMCFTLAFFTLLCGLVLDGFSDVVSRQLAAEPDKTLWTNYNTGEFQATCAFAYICFCMFILFALALVLFQSAVSEELGLNTGMAAFNPYARMQDPQFGLHMGMAGEPAKMGMMPAPQMPVMQAMQKPAAPVSGAGVATPAALGTEPQV